MITESINVLDAYGKQYMCQELDFRTDSHVECHFPSVGLLLGTMVAVAIPTIRRGICRILPTRYVAKVLIG